MDVIALISLIIGLIGTLFGVFIALRTKQINKPAIQFRPGTTQMRKKEIPRKYRNRVVSTIAYGARLPSQECGYILFPLIIENTSKLPVNNIRITLNYPSKYCVSKKEIEREIAPAVKLQEDSIDRKIQILSDIVSVTMEIQLLRPGEKLGFGDVIKLLNEKHQQINMPEVPQLSERIYKIGGVGSFFPIDIFIFSENCPPISYRVNLLWFNTNSLKEIQQLLPALLEEFWGGKYPKAGIYFSPLPWRRFFKNECAEIIIPDLVRVTNAKGKNIWIENPMESTGALVEMLMPSWNYYEENRKNIEKFYEPLSSAAIKFLRKSRQKYFPDAREKRDNH